MKEMWLSLGSGPQDTHLSHQDILHPTPRKNKPLMKVKYDCYEETVRLRNTNYKQRTQKTTYSHISGIGVTSFELSLWPADFSYVTKSHFCSIDLLVGSCLPPAS